MYRIIIIPQMRCCRQENKIRMNMIILQIMSFVFTYLSWFVLTISDFILTISDFNDRNLVITENNII